MTQLLLPSTNDQKTNKQTNKQTKQQQQTNKKLNKKQNKKHCDKYAEYLHFIKFFMPWTRVNQDNNGVM